MSGRTLFFVGFEALDAVICYHNIVCTVSDENVKIVICH